MRAWLVGAALIAVLFGAIGCGLRERSPDGVDPGGPAPLSIVRHGNEFTLTGDVPDPAAKRALLDAVLTSADDVTVVDRLGLAPRAATPDFTGAGPVFEAAAGLGDFTLRASGNTVTLGGTAAKAAEATAVTDAAAQAWPKAEIVDGIESPSLAPPSPSAPSGSTPGMLFAPLSILRNGNVITLNGNLPDINTRAGLLDMLTGIYGGGMKLVDNLTIKPDAKTPDFAALGSVFRAAASMPDFKFKIIGDTVTLIGTADTDAVQSAVTAAATAAWPNFKLSNNILVPPRPTTDCANLQADIAALMSAPVTFETDGSALSTASRQQLGRVAEKVKGCRSAHLAVSGYTDNTGNEGINVPLSAARAKSVADFLVAHGVPAETVTSEGFGSSDPVAGNATPDGRAQNRRVVITVS